MAALVAAAHKWQTAITRTSKNAAIATAANVAVMRRNATETKTERNIDELGENKPTMNKIICYKKYWAATIFACALMASLSGCSTVSQPSTSAPRGGSPDITWPPTGR